MSQPKNVPMIRLVLQSLLWRGLQFIALFGLNLVVARFFGASGAGAIHFTIAGLSLVALIGSGNLEAAMTYFISSGRIPAARLVTLGWVWTIGIALLILAATPVLDAGLRLPSVLFVTGALLTSFYTALFYGRRQFRQPNLLVALCHFGLIAWVMWVPRSPHASPPAGYLTAYGCMYVVQGLLMLVAFHRQHAGTFRWQWPAGDERSRIFQYAFVLLAGNLLLFFLYRLDYWMLMYGLPENGKLEAVGNYIQASKMSHLFILVSGMAGSAVFAGTAGKSPEEAALPLARLIRLVLVFGLVLFVLFIVCAELLFTGLFGPAFRAAGQAFVLLFPGVIGIMTASLTANYLAGRGWPRYNLIGVGAGLGLIILANLWLIPRLGIFGAALSSTAGYLAYSAYLLTVFKSTSGMSWRRIFDAQSDLQLVRRYWQRKNNGA